MEANKIKKPKKIGEYSINTCELTNKIFERYSKVLLSIPTTEYKELSSLNKNLEKLIKDKLLYFSKFKKGDYVFRIVKSDEKINIFEKYKVKKIDFNPHKCDIVYLVERYDDRELIEEVFTQCELIPIESIPHKFYINNNNDN